MNSPRDAIAILTEARDELIARLRRRVVEDEVEILADARGESYLSEIETIYDQIASRLAHVNQMISNLPPDVASLERIGTVDDGELVETVTSPDSTQMTPQHETQLQPSKSPASAAPATFQRFLQFIDVGDATSAGIVLAELFQIDPLRGEQCADVFLRRYVEDVEIVSKAMRIRQELTSGNFNNAIMLLYDCFGLQGMESIAAMETLRAML